MKKQNQVANKSFNFAKRIYFLYKFLKEEKKEYILSKQILRSGTSIGANVSFRFHPSPYHSGFTTRPIILVSPLALSFWFPSPSLETQSQYEK